MATNHFNDLSEADAEALAILAEECGEVIQAICKILRHGWESTYDNGVTNRYQLEVECGDVRASMIRLCNRESLDKAHIHERADSKLRSTKFLHHL